MKAVSNTSPLRYPIAVEHDHLPGALFDKLVLPRAGYEELTDRRS